MRTLVRDQLTAQRMQMTVVEGIEVTPSEVREFYENLPTDSVPLISFITHLCNQLLDTTIHICLNLFFPHSHWINFRMVDQKSLKE